jgi:CDP-glucose 4,6-dehydratase
LQALRGSGAQAAVMVTTDKVYRNNLPRAFVETDPLGGDDPYSASKAACEVLVESHRMSFADLPPIATARAGNVIGGGDFGRDRLIPDLIRAQMAGEPLKVRNPSATRPFQHVLDVISGYLLLAEALATGKAPLAANLARQRQSFPCATCWPNGGGQPARRQIGACWTPSPWPRSRALPWKAVLPVPRLAGRPA